MQTKTKLKTNNKLANTKKNLPVKAKNKVIDDGEYLFLERIIDRNGISVINIDHFNEENEHLISSKYGATPLISFGNTNFNKPITKICVIKKFDNSFYQLAANNAMRLANQQASMASKEYHDELEKINLTKQKNLAIAKVDSLRILNKAIILEKQVKENKYEKQRHKESINEIKKLHKALLEKNDVERDENISQLNHIKSIKLNKLATKRNKSFVNLERKYQIEIEKRNMYQDKIETLARGEKYSKNLYREKVANINNRYKTTMTDKNLLEQTVDSVASILGTIDYYKLNSEERKIFDKFFDALEQDNQFERRARAIESYHEQVLEKEEEVKLHRGNVSNLDNRKAYIVSNQEFNKIINANKNFFGMKVDATKFANEYKTLYQTYLEIDEKNGKKQPAPKETYSLVTTKKKPRKEKVRKQKKQQKNTVDFNDTKKQNDFLFNQEQVNKWRKIQKDIENADSYDVVKLKDGNYQINYKYEKLQAKEERKERINDLESQYRQQKMLFKNMKKAQKINKDIYLTQDGEQVVERKIRTTPKYISKNKIVRLKKDFNYLINSQLTYENIHHFEQENLDLQQIASKLNLIDEARFKNNKQNREFIKYFVEKAIKIYQNIEEIEVAKERRKIRSQKLDYKLNMNIQKTELAFGRSSSLIENKYMIKREKIKNRFADADQHILNRHFIEKEAIIEHEIASLNKEQENHLNNLSWYRSNSQKFQKLNFKFQNKEIEYIIKKINKHNQRSSDPISLDDLPPLINPNVFNRTNVYLNLAQEDNKVIVNTLIDKKLASIQALNRLMPTNVKKIYVLDKFRNVKDIDTKVALLRELSAINYANDLKYIDLIEQKEIELAKEKIIPKLEKAEKLRADAEFIRRQAIFMNSDSIKMSMIQNDELRLKKVNWAITDNEAKLLNRQLEREIKLQEKINKLENK